MEIVLPLIACLDNELMLIKGMKIVKIQHQETNLAALVA